MKRVWAVLFLVLLIPSAKGTAANDLNVQGLEADPEVLVDRLLTVIEQNIVPLTREGTKAGNKLFGAAVLKKSDLSLVVSSTNRETGNPLNHGEIQTIFEYFAIPIDQRPPPVT